MDKLEKSDDAEVKSSTTVFGLPAETPQVPEVFMPSHELLRSLSGVVRVFNDQNGVARLQVDNRRVVCDLASAQAEVELLRVIAPRRGIPKRQELRDAIDQLRAYARITADQESVWLRVAPVEGGVAIDVADAANTRIWVTTKGVEIRCDNSGPLFYRTPTMRPLALPADDGDVELLRPYLNMSEMEAVLLVAWLTYVLCHPRRPGVAYPILLLRGDQGSGKSFLCRVIRALLDSSTIGLQAFPRTERDLAIAISAQFVCVFDNMREVVRPGLSDGLCQAATGGAYATRQLYSDSALIVLQLQGAIVLNSIHPPVSQPDLAQRCLPLHLRSLDSQRRRREDQLLDDLQRDLPKILRGLLDLASAVMAELPAVEPTDPERLAGFSHWLAGMEAVRKLPVTAYQDAFSAVLRDGICESLEAQPLIAALVEFLDESDSDTWSGTPASLLQGLELRSSRRAQYAHDWPPNAIALSKRLRGLQGVLTTLGIEVQFGRRNERLITLRRKEARHD